MNGKRLDPNDDRAAYKQLADLLRYEILSGRLAGGEELPSKKAMAEQHRVSINTVDGALGLLRAEGLIIMRQGHRSRVRPVRFFPADRSRVGSQNYQPDVESRFAAEHGVPFSAFELTREYRTIAPPPRIASALRLAEDADVCERRWTHAIDGIALRVSWSYLAMDRFAGTVLTDINEPPWPGGTIAQLTSLRITIKDVRHEIVTRLATPEEAQVLGLDSRTYVQEDFRVQLAADGKPVEAAIHVRPPNNVQLFTVPLEVKPDLSFIAPD